MYVRINYSNGYCGCDVSEVLKVESMEEAEKYADEELHDYAESYAYVAEGYDYGSDWESEEAEDWYYDNCSYWIEEITKEEYEEVS